MTASGGGSSRRSARATSFDEDPRFADIAARTANIDSLYDMIADELKTRPTAEWLKLLHDADVAYMVPHTLETLLEDPHLRGPRLLPVPRASLGRPDPHHARAQHLVGNAAARPTALRRGSASTRGEILAEAGYTPGRDR